jgi:RNA polymerase sigma-70 factor, ECF subfamily
MSSEKSSDLRTMEDAELLAYLAAGNDQALAVLMERHSSWVSRIAYHVLRDRGEAKDMVQEVFGKLYETAIRFDPEKGTFMAWLFHITRNQAIKRRRYLRARSFYSNVRLDELKEFRSSTEVADWHRLAPQERSLLLQEVLATLKSAQRKTIEMKFLEGLSTAGVAEQLGKSVESVENNLSRTVRKLRRLFRKDVSVSPAD